MTEIHTVKVQDRDPRKEYPAQTKITTPVNFGRSPYPDDFKSQLEEFSRMSAERNHVETIEEANDFGDMSQPEDEDFFEQTTVYEMHEIQAEAVEDTPEEAPQIDVAETPDSDVQGDLDFPEHDQSAPDPELAT